MIEGISHITFVVKDLEKTSALLRAVFDAQEIYSSGDKTFSISREKFFLIGKTWIAIMEGSARYDKDYNHVAFKIPDEEFESYLKRVTSAEVEIKPPRPRVDGEGRSLYFYDYDNHLFELHTGTLEQRLNHYAAG